LPESILYLVSVDETHRRACTARADIFFGRYQAVLLERAHIRRKTFNPYIENSSFPTPLKPRCKQLAQRLVYPHSSECLNLAKPGCSAGRQQCRLWPDNGSSQGRCECRLQINSCRRQSLPTTGIVTLTGRTGTGICDSLSRWITSPLPAIDFHRISFATPFGSMPGSL
jgi:hypothetical protein